MPLPNWIAVVVLSAGLGVVHAAERDFTLSDAHGVSHDLNQHRGKWVVVNYWATWCPPCLAEIPELVKFHAKHKDRDAVVIGVDYEDIPAGQLDAFVKKLGINYPIMQDDPMQDSAFGPIPAMPTTFLINPDGELVAKETGPVTAAGLESYIRRKAAAQPKPPASPAQPVALPVPAP